MLRSLMRPAFRSRAACSVAYRQHIAPLERTSGKGRQRLSYGTHTNPVTFVEEQYLLRHRGKQYYPVKPGQLLDGRYAIITKLSYGAFSTVWLARDLKKSREYTVLKVCVQHNNERDASAILQEIKMLQKLRECPRHPADASFARTADDIFHVYGPQGPHFCIALRPHGCDLWTLRQLFDKSQMIKEFVMDYVHRIILCVNWLHVECGIMHGDINTRNVLTKLASDKTFQRLQDEEAKDPTVVTWEEDYPIYLSNHATPVDLLDLKVEPVLTDFGCAKSAGETYRGWAMSDTYRAPEVLLGLPWGCELDMWCIGIMTLELLEGRPVFDPIDYEKREYVLELALAQYISLLGPPPLEVLQRSEDPSIWKFFNADGGWRSDYRIPQTSLEDFVTVFPAGSKEKTTLLNFIRRALTWDPTTRATSGQLFVDKWLMPNGLPAGSADAKATG